MNTTPTIGRRRAVPAMQGGRTASQDRFEFDPTIDAPLRRRRGRSNGASRRAVSALVATIAGAAGAASTATAIAAAAAVASTATAIAAAGPPPPPTPGTLLVSDFATDRVYRFAAADGAVVGPIGTPSLDGPLGAVLAPDGTLLVASELADTIARVDPVTGAALADFVPAGGGGLVSPSGVIIGPDVTGDGVGDVLVASFAGDLVRRYDGATGASLGVVVTPGSGGLDGPDAGIAIGPDGLLYVPSYWSNQVLRYDAVTGDFVDVFAAPFPGPLLRPRTVLFEPGGTVLVSAEASDKVLRYDAATGALLGTVVTVDGPTGLALDDAGWLYVASVVEASVARYDAATGALDAVVVPGGAGGLMAPTFIVLQRASDPTPCAADLDGDGAVGFADLVALLGAWGPCDACPADLDGDDTVGLSDLLTVLAAWGPCGG